MQTVVSSRRRRWDLCLTIFHLSCVYKQPVTSIFSSSCFERWMGFFRIADGKFFLSWGTVSVNRLPLCFIRI